MKATLTSDNGAQLFEVPMPTVGERDVLVKVRAAGLNRADLSVLAGQRHGSASGPGTPLGLEWAGDVVSVGSAVKHVRVGERVMCSGRGGMAEYAVTDLGRVMPIPRDDMSYELAAGLPIALQTMHDAVITHGQLQPGQSLLVQGASAGVGLMAMQIAKWRGASCVIGTSTDASRRSRLNEMGADLALDSRDPSWVEQVLKATQGRGVDIVFDHLGGQSLIDGLHSLAPLGTLVSYNIVQGMPTEDVFQAMRHLLGKSLAVRCFSMHTFDEDVAIRRALMQEAIGLMANAQVKAPECQVFKFSEVRQTHALLDGGMVRGKLVMHP